VFTLYLETAAKITARHYILIGVILAAGSKSEGPNACCTIHPHITVHMNSEHDVEALRRL
jgi:hypothetical protein